MFSSLGNGLREYMRTATRYAIPEWDGAHAAARERGATFRIASSVQLVEVLEAAAAGVERGHAFGIALLLDDVHLDSADRFRGGEEGFPVDPAISEQDAFATRRPVVELKSPGTAWVPADI